MSMGFLDWLITGSWVALGEQRRQYYDQLSRDTIRDRMRSHNILKRPDQVTAKALRELFLEYAVLIDTPDGSHQVWQLAQFGRFLASRLGHEDKHLTAVLWRMFYHKSHVPFTDELTTDESLQYTTIDDWSQAVSYTTYQRKEPIDSMERRRDVHWNNFYSSATRVSRRTQAEEDSWTPPDMLDRITQRVIGSAPTPRKSAPPTVAKVRSMVRDIFGECETVLTQDFELQYEELLALLTATLQVGEGGRSMQHSSLASNVAQALLDVAGIESGSTVTWNDYLAFTERFYSLDAYNNWMFEHIIVDLFKALFKVDPDEATLTQPHCTILRALDFLMPAYDDDDSDEEEDAIHFSDALQRRDRWDSKVVYNAEAKDVSIGDVVTAFKDDLNAKLFVFTGKIQNDQNTSPAVFAVLMTSPMWDEYRGNIEDSQIQTRHFILRILPRPRALWYTQERMLLKDHMRRDEESLSFGGSDSSSGLLINLKTGEMTMRCTGSPDDDYVEIAIDARMPATPVQRPEPWHVVAKLEKLEIYDLD